MAQILTQAEVDALLAAVLDESSSTEAKVMPRPKVPTQEYLKSGSNAERRLPMLESVSNRYSKILRKNLTSVLHKPVKVKILSQTVTNYPDWVRTLSFPACIGIAELGTSSKSMAVAMETSLLFSVLETLFGNTSEPVRSFENKELSKVEASLATRLISSFFDSLNEAWQPYLSMNLGSYQLETQPHELLFCHPQEVILSQSYMVSFGDNGAKVRLIYPVGTLDYIKESQMSDENNVQGPSEAFRKDIFPQLTQASVEVRALLAKGKMKLKDVLDLRLGDQLDIAEWSPSVIRLEIEGKRKFDGVLGQNQGRHIVRIK